MKVEDTGLFQDKYVDRISSNPQLQKQVDKRLVIFQNNPNNPLLDDHPLKGELEGYRAFSVNKTIRVVYYIKNEIAYLVTIGTHEQVYTEIRVPR